MSASPRVPVVRVAFVVAATATMPALIRGALSESIDGPITGAHVLLAQIALLLLVALVARGGLHQAGRSQAPWCRWARDATRFSGALVLMLVGRIVTGHHESVAVSLESVTLLVTAPIVEEIVYRGILPMLLADCVGSANGAARRVGIAIVSSAAFAAAHLGGEGSSEAELGRFALSFCCGLGFHLLRDASGGLAAPMAAHAGVNAMSLRAMG